MRYLWLARARVVVVTGAAVFRLGSNSRAEYCIDTTDAGAGVIAQPSILGNRFCYEL